MKTAWKEEAVAEWIPTKPKAKCRVSWESIAVREKQDNMKKKQKNLSPERTTLIKKNN